MPRVYIHEIVEVDGTRRADYQHHMTANWVPEASGLRRQRCFGVFSVVGSTGPWPRVVNIWEYDSWDDLAHNFSVELSGPTHRDPMLQRWWDEAAALRSGGLDRVLVAHGDSPGVELWAQRGGAGAVAYLHELLWTEPGGAPALEARVARDGVRRMADAGMDLVGLWRTAMRADDEVLALWSIPDWQHWAAFEETAFEETAFAGTATEETASGVATAQGSARGDRVVTARQCWLLVDAELSPLRIGRQPQLSDRRPIDRSGA
ncbi:MAG: NIPSNAP family containing protein [Microthrixaceae bacterium]